MNYLFSLFSSFSFIFSSLSLLHLFSFNPQSHDEYSYTSLELLESLPHHQPDSLTNIQPPHQLQTTVSKEWLLRASPASRFQSTHHLLFLPLIRLEVLSLVLLSSVLLLSRRIQQPGMILSIILPASGSDQESFQYGSDETTQAEMETFQVELVKDQQGLGITIAGYVCEKGDFFLFSPSLLFFLLFSPSLLFF